MASLHVNLTVGQNTSMPHMPATLDPQMRVFFQRNLDPFDSALSLTDLLRAAGNFLGAARSSLSWARQFFWAPPSPQTSRGEAKPGKRSGNGNGNGQPTEAEEKEAHPAPKSGSGLRPQAAPPPAEEPATEERVRRTREAGRRATAEAEQRFRRARKEERAEKPLRLAGLPRGYGLHLAIELALDRSRKPKRTDEEEDRSRSGRGVDAAPGRAFPGLSFRGSVSVHFPLDRVAAAGRRGGEGR